MIFIVCQPRPIDVKYTAVSRTRRCSFIARMIPTNRAIVSVRDEKNVCDVWEMDINGVISRSCNGEEYFTCEIHELVVFLKPRSNLTIIS